MQGSKARSCHSVVNGRGRLLYVQMTTLRERRVCTILHPAPCTLPIPVYLVYTLTLYTIPIPYIPYIPYIYRYHELPLPSTLYYSTSPQVGGVRQPRRLLLTTTIVTTIVHAEEEDEKMSLGKRPKRAPNDEEEEEGMYCPTPCTLYPTYTRVSSVYPSSMHYAYTLYRGIRLPRRLPAVPPRRVKQ
jgi:hypothetical protein